MRHLPYTGIRTEYSTISDSLRMSVSSAGTGGAGEHFGFGLPRICAVVFLLVIIFTILA